MTAVNRIQRLIGVVAILLWTTSSVAQTTWYVDDGNCPGPGDGSIGNPFCTIQQGIDAAVNGDEVVVADGVYTGTGNVNLDFGGSLIMVRSENGAANCIIDCEDIDGQRGVIFQSGEDETAILRGFTIRNGVMVNNPIVAAQGGGILIRGSSPSIDECVISSCTSNNGAALTIRGDSHPRITNTTIEFSVAAVGGRPGALAVLGSSATIVSCRFQTNYGTGNGFVIRLEDSNVQIVNSIVENNPGSSHRIIHVDNSELDIINCTILDNAQFLSNESVNSVRLYNSIVWNTEPIFEMEERASVFDVRNCIIRRLVQAEPGNFYVDPMIDMSGTYVPLPCSPCIDAGDSSLVPPEFLTDLNGASRFYDDQFIHVPSIENALAVDIGAVERQSDSHQTGSSTVFVPTDYPDIDTAVADDCVREIVLLDGTYNIGGFWDYDVKDRILTIRSLNGPATCTINAQFNNQDPFRMMGFCGLVVEGITFENFSHENEFTGGGTASLRSIASLQYRNCIFRNCTATAVVFFRGSLLIEDCTFDNVVDTARGAVYLELTEDAEGGQLTIRKCTFKNCGNHGIEIVGSPHLDRITSPVSISECTFLDNVNTNSAAIDGGGAILTETLASTAEQWLTIDRCRFLGNQTQTNGGALYLQSNAKIINSTFAGNGADENGGAVFQNPNGSISILNSTIVMNSANLLGPGLYIDDADVANSIIRDNGLSQINGNLQNLSITYTNVSVPFAGTGNIDADPMFVDWDGLDGMHGTLDDDYRLQSGSPSVDAGDNSAVPTGVVADLDGFVRQVDDPDMPDTGSGAAPIVDMGAFEWQRDGCIGDITNVTGIGPDGAVDVFDLLELLNNWGTDGPGADIEAPFDVVDVFDLLSLLNAWGDCP